MSAGHTCKFGMRFSELADYQQILASARSDDSLKTWMLTFKRLNRRIEARLTEPTPHSAAIYENGVFRACSLCAQIRPFNSLVDCLHTLLKRYAPPAHLPCSFFRLPHGRTQPCRAYWRIRRKKLKILWTAIRIFLQRVPCTGTIRNFKLYSNFSYCEHLTRIAFWMIYHCIQFEVQNFKLIYCSVSLSDWKISSTRKIFNYIFNSPFLTHINWRTCFFTCIAKKVWSLWLYRPCSRY